MNHFLPQMEPVFDEDEVRAVADCIRSTWVIEAERTAAFEQAIAAYTGARYAVAVPSCTVALAVSLMALGVGPGDEVLVPDLTFVASANAVNLAGGEPVFVDIDPRSFGLDPQAVLASLTTRTKAIIPVWFNGRPSNIEEIVALAATRGLAIVEDAACALGSRVGSKHAGTFGDLGCISFNTTKIITTGTGGMVLTDDAQLYEQVERLKNHGRLDRSDYHPQIGYNFSFSDLLAALGLAQMDKLPQRVTRKKALYHWYHARLADLPGVDLFRPDAATCLWYPDIFVDDPAGLHEFLLAHDIQTRLFFPPVHTQPCYRRPGPFPGTCHVSARGLWLPSADYVTEATVEKICTHIREWATRHAPPAPASRS